jgi:hypothetical protein
VNISKNCWTVKLCATPATGHSTNLSCKNEKKRLDPPEKLDLTFKLIILVEWVHP